MYILYTSICAVNLFQVTDTEDPFEELKHSGRSSLTGRTAMIPRDNIAPFIHTTSFPVMRTTSEASSSTSKPSTFLSDNQKSKQGKPDLPKKRKVSGLFAIL